MCADTSKRRRWRAVGERALMPAVALYCVSTLCAVGWAQTTDDRLAVLGSNVACRTAPSLSGEVVQRLDVAELVHVAPRDAGLSDWVQATTAGSATCFVSRRLVTPFDAAAPERAVVAIVDRTARLEGRIPFGRMAAVHALFEDRWQDITVEGSAEMELLELQVLLRTAHSIDGWEDMVRWPWPDRRDPRTALRRREIAAWINRNESRVHYFELGAVWGVLPDTFWALHDKYRHDPLADRIAWLASRKYPGGECEGHVPCYLGHMLAPEFEYLRRHPRGAYVTEVLKGVLDYLKGLDSGLRSSRACKGRGSVELAARIDGIGAVLDRVADGLVREVEMMLDALARPC